MNARYPTDADYGYVLCRDEWTCQYCGRDCRDGDGVIDHVVPHALGGPSKLYNLALSCRPCNTRKSQSVWIPRNFLSITLDHPDWRATVVRMLLQQITQRLTPIEAWQMAALMEEHAANVRASLEK